MNHAKWCDQTHAEPVWIEAEAHLGEKFKKDVEENDPRGKAGQQKRRPGSERLIKGFNADGKDDDVGHDIAHKNRPQKILRILQVLMERRSSGIAGTPLLPD